MFFVYPFTVGFLISLVFFVVTLFLKRKSFPRSIQLIPSGLNVIVATITVYYALTYIRGWEGALCGLMGVSLYIYTVFIIGYVLRKR